VLISVQNIVIIWVWHTYVKIWVMSLKDVTSLQENVSLTIIFDDQNLLVTIVTKLYIDY